MHIRMTMLKIKWALPRAKEVDLSGEKIDFFQDTCQSPHKMISTINLITGKWMDD